MNTVIWCSFFKQLFLPFLPMTIQHVDCKYVEKNGEVFLYICCPYQAERRLKGAGCVVLIGYDCLFLKQDCTEISAQTT